MAIVTSFSNIKNLGDCILCRYTATTSGSVGYFSELGTSTSAEIPLTGTTTPDGIFYWIYVGKDYKGRKKFIADRVIQNSISWDTLNLSGLINEKIIDLGLGTSYNTSIRLLNGGTSSTDIDNEWDKIIVASTLNNTITAGDNNIWHWNSIWSWTSTTSTTNSKKVIRGSNVVNFFSEFSNTTASIGGGYRPVLIVEKLVTYKYLIKQNNYYYTIKSTNYDSTNTHNFNALTLLGGSIPNSSDINTYGFDNLSVLTTSMTVNTDVFVPVTKLNDQFEIKMYKG